MRFLAALALMVMALLTPVLAQEDDSAPWQATVTGQVEALRAHDGTLALTFAGEAFRTQFEKTPDAFYGAIIASGYGPIAESRSHSFGEINRISDTNVTQIVKFVGNNQKLYEAIYQLSNEPDEGWRVIAVALREEAGISI